MANFWNSGHSWLSFGLVLTRMEILFVIPDLKKHRTLCNAHISINLLNHPKLPNSRTTFSPSGYFSRDQRPKNIESLPKIPALGRLGNIDIINMKSIFETALIFYVFNVIDFFYFRQKLTSPKWNRFRGIRLRWKDKIRLNNVIWRCWHLQCK